MVDQFQIKVTSLRYCLLFLLLLFPLNVIAQTASAPEETAGTNADAMKFLNQVFALYARARTYHLESIEDSETSGPFIRGWNRILKTAIVAPVNRYRFEARGPEFWLVQISDGKTEWLYQPDLREYLQRPTPSSDPSRLNAPQVRGAFWFKEAQDSIKNLLALQDLLLSAEFLPDEEVEVNGKPVACRVIQAQEKARPKIVQKYKFWIERDTSVIRKFTKHSEGSLRPTRPEDHHISDKTVLFTVADLAGGPFPNQVFTFDPPVQAALVKEFETDPEMARIHALEGKPVPPIELRSVDGKIVPLKSFSGKPVLLDFWATWCVPCVESLPALEKLHHEAAAKGLVMISIDEDEDSKAAADLWTKRKEPWPNFHDDGAILKQLPSHGIPFFVLIDASGNTVFSKAGLYEDELRTALAKLDPAFAPLSPPSAP